MKNALLAGLLVVGSQKIIAPTMNVFRSVVHSADLAGSASEAMDFLQRNGYGVVITLLQSPAHCRTRRTGETQADLHGLSVATFAAEQGTKLIVVINNDKHKHPHTEIALKAMGATPHEKNKGVVFIYLEGELFINADGSVIWKNVLAHLIAKSSG